MDREDHQSPSSQPPYLGQVLVIRPPPVFAVHEQYISKKFQILKAYESPLPTHEFLQAYAQSTKVVLCANISPITADVLRHLPALQLVVSCTTGVNHIDMASGESRIKIYIVHKFKHKGRSNDPPWSQVATPLDMAECRRRGIRVANIGDVFSDDVADGAVGLLIDVMRKITAGGRLIRGGRWPATMVCPLGSKLGGKRIGIVGLGNIGSRVATRLEAMGCKISYTSKHKKHSTSFTFYPDVLQLTFHSDALIICCALTDDTRHMINNRVMQALGKTGVIVNVARGAIIDEVDLVKCLVEGDIGGVGLDVFENEPYVPKELFKLDNVVLLSHKTAITKECFHDAAQIVVANQEAFFMNKLLINLVS